MHNKSAPGQREGGEGPLLQPIHKKKLNHALAKYTSEIVSTWQADPPLAMTNPIWQTSQMVGLDGITLLQLATALQR